MVGEGDLNESLVELLMPETPLRRDMIDYSRSFALVSFGIAAVTAFVLYVLVSRLFIDPVLRVTSNMLAFRKAPENAALILIPSRRSDEIGILERELADMETELFSMLRQRRHLADLGLAVAKINHDLRNTLSSAQLLSDQVATLGRSQGPAACAAAGHHLGQGDRLCPGRSRLWPGDVHRTAVLPRSTCARWWKTQPLMRALRAIR